MKQTKYIVRTFNLYDAHAFVHLYNELIYRTFHIHKTKTNNRNNYVAFSMVFSITLAVPLRRNIILSLSPRPVAWNYKYQANKKLADSM